MRLGREVTSSAPRKHGQHGTPVAVELQLTGLSSGSQHFSSRSEISIGKLRASGSSFSCDTL